MITKWVFMYIQFAASISQRWSSSACWKPGSKKVPGGALDVDQPLGVRERRLPLPSADPAHELIARCTARKKRPKLDRASRQPLGRQAVQIALSGRSKGHEVAAL